jgi:hypothetical protein
VSFISRSESPRFKKANPGSRRVRFEKRNA